MPMRIPTRRRSGDVEVQMTAMIDVVFLLLIFFLSASAFERLEYDLPSGLAAPVDPQTVDSQTAAAASATGTAPPALADHLDDLLITLRSAGGGLVEPSINGQTVTETELQAQLAAIGSLTAHPVVIIRPLDGITMGQAIGVFDAAKQAGLLDVRWAVTPE